MGEALDGFEDGGLGFEAGDSVAYAEVGAGAEGEVGVVETGWVEGVGVFELFGVAVGGAEHDEDGFAGAEGGALDFEVLFGEPGDVLDGALEAEEFFDAAADEVGVVA